MLMHRRNFVEDDQRKASQVRIGKPRDKEEDRRTTLVTSTTTEVTTAQFSYPEAWKDNVPKFPFVPPKDEMTSAKATTGPENTKASKTSTTKTTLTTPTTKDMPETEWKMPVFPFDKSSINKR